MRGRFVERDTAAEDRLTDATVTVASLAVQTWADGFGRWHGRIAGVASVAQANRVRWAIIAEIAAREQTTRESLADARRRIAAGVQVERSPRHDEPGRMAYREAWEEA